MIIKKLVVGNGSYTTADGQSKTRWVTIGALHDHEGRKYITLDRHFNLSGFESQKEGDTRLFVQLFDPDKGQQTHKQPTKQPSSARAAAKPDFDDDLPF